MAPAADAKGKAATVKLVTWNVKDFFDDVDDPATIDKVVTAEQFAQKVELLAAALKPLKADVLALQEVENPRALDALAEAVDPERFPPANRVWVAGGRDGRSLALLTGHPVSRVVDHAKDPLPFEGGVNPYPDFKSNAIEVHLETGARPMVVLVAHLLFNGAGPQAAEYRHAQAKTLHALAARLTEEDPSRLVVIAGDLNDKPQAPSLQTLTQGGMVDAMGDRPMEERFTNTLKGRQRVLDYVIANEAPLEATTVQSNQMKAASDHAAVDAIFNLGRR